MARWLYLYTVRLKTPTAVSERTKDDAVFTRYDTPARIKEYLPPSLSYETARGIRILTPVAAAHRVPGLGHVLRRAEIGLADVPGVRELGGFLVAVARKT